MDAVNLWIDAHPAIATAIKAFFLAINHPLISLIITFLSIFILWQVVKLFSRFVEQGLLITLKAPLKFSQYLFKFAFKPFGNAVSGLGMKRTEGIQASNSVNYNYQEQMAKLLTRLETIRQEENYILKEISTIVASSK